MIYCKSVAQCVRPNPIWQQFFIALVCTLFTYGPICSAMDHPKFTVGFWGAGDYTDCDSSEEIVYYVGGTYDIIVTLLPHGERPGEVEYTGISDWTWPSGLEITTGQTSDLLALKYYVTKQQAHYDSVWKATGDSPPPMRTAPEYHFAFRIPITLAGSRLCVSARWHHPLFGDLVAEEPACIMVHSPCTIVGQHAVWRTNVHSVYEQGRLDMTIALADSFIALDWRDLTGLTLARNAARQLGRYDDAIRFLDICFDANHTVDLMMAGKTSSAPTDADRQNYLRIRANLAEAKNQQQQH